MTTTGSHERLRRRTSVRRRRAMPLIVPVPPGFRGGALSDILRGKVRRSNDREGSISWLPMHQGKDRRARRLRLYRRRSWCACCCGIRMPRSRCSPPTAAPGRRWRRCFRNSRRMSLPKLVSIDGIDWACRRARHRLLRAAARHHAEGDQGLCSRARPRRAWSTCRPTSGSRPTPMRAGTATSTRRRSCRSEAVYGLTEVYRDEVAKARLVANPGCYTTCAQLALIPLLRANAIDPGEIVDRCQIRHDRSGRAAKEEMLFSEVSEGIHAYGVGHHRHMAELDQEFSKAAGREVIVELHAASHADEPRHPLDDLCQGRKASAEATARHSFEAGTRTSRSCMCCRSGRCRRPGMCAAPT